MYEIFPEIEQENADTELRMFVRLENERRQITASTVRRKLFSSISITGRETVTFSSEIVSRIGRTQNLSRPKR